MKLWLDDERDPVDFGQEGFTWAKNIWDARLYLESGEVSFASLDHDLGPGYSGFSTGYDLINWMEANDIWPKDGISIHSMNPVGRKQMEVVVYKHYGRNFSPMS